RQPVGPVGDGGGRLPRKAQQNLRRVVPVVDKRLGPGGPGHLKGEIPLPRRFIEAAGGGKTAVHAAVTSFHGKRPCAIPDLVLFSIVSRRKTVCQGPVDNRGERCYNGCSHNSCICNEKELNPLWTTKKN